MNVPSEILIAQSTTFPLVGWNEAWNTATVSRTDLALLVGVRRTRDEVLAYITVQVRHGHKTVRVECLLSRRISANKKECSKTWGECVVRDERIGRLLVVDTEAEVRGWSTTQRNATTDTAAVVT